MPETIADIGFGAQFGIGDGGDPETFALAAEIVSITPPSLTRGDEEATHLASPESYKEYIPLLFDTGDAQLTLHFEPSATDAIYTAFHADPKNYQITFPNGVMMRFKGFFTEYAAPELTPEGKMEATATIKRSTGKPSLHAAA